MNPYLCRVELRPRGPLEVFDLSVRFMRERIRPLTRMSLAVLLPVWVVLSVAAWWFDGHVGLLVAVLVVGHALQAPFTALAGRLLFEEEVGVGEVLRGLLRQVPALVASWTVAALAWISGALTCMVGLPWFLGASLYFPETSLLERVGTQRGLRRTVRLAGGQVGNTVVGILAKVMLLGWFAAMGEACGQAVVGFVFQLGQPFGSIADPAVTPYLIGGVLLYQPVYAVYRLFLYVDVRTRVEGWDLQVSLRAAGLAT